MSQYQLHEKIGEGGMGDVYRATLPGSPGAFAIKMLRDYRNGEARARFAREVKMLVGLRHPMIVQVIESNATCERPFYVMPLMTGGTLARYAGQLDHATSRIVLRGLAEALDFIHRGGGLHRDVKPENVLVDAKGALFVGDLGLGNDPRFTIHFTVSAAGTPGFIAPEMQRPGAQASHAADVFSLGVTMFNVLTGVHPTRAESLDPWHYKGDVPADLRGLVIMMLQADPRMRPTAKKVFELASHGVAPKAPPPHPPKAQNPKAALGAAALIGGFILLLLGLS